MRRAHACFTSCAPGLEGILVDELDALGVRARRQRGGATFDATTRELYALNLWLRTASHLLVRVANFHAADFARRAKEMDGTPQSSYYHLEFGRLGHVLDGLNMDPAADPQILLTWSTAPDSNVFRWVGDYTTEFAGLAGGAAAR